MRILLSWLEDFVDVPEPQHLSHRLTEAGVEVEGIEDTSGLIADARICEVREVAPHPQADRLRVCQIFDGEATRTVVCGAPDVRAPMRAVYLPVGGSFTGGLIERRIIRGIESDGMLCSQADLGLAEKSENLWAMADDAVIGAPLGDVVPAKVVYDLSITPNRPDLLSHLGVAREVAAATGRRLKPGKGRVAEKGPDVSLLARALVDEPTLCRRYMARVVRNIKVGPSPAWLVDRLEAVGQRAINNVVDVTNYVMHELGQPLHAYDLSRLALEANLPTLHVRRAQPNERLRTLDDVDRALDPQDLVVADAMRPVALAGVMGGMDTWVHAGTTTVLIEGANFAPGAVRQTAKRHGLRTEASHRFERGCDPGLVARAIDRCAQLLIEAAEADAAKGFIEVAQKNEGPIEVSLRLERIGQILGLTIGTEAVVQLLDPLGFRCQARTDRALIFEVPTFRPDVTREIDLIEEIARRYGYGKLPERLPNTQAAFHFTELTVRPQDRARAALLPTGLTEVVNYALANPAHMMPYEGAYGVPVSIRNPVGEELSVLRTTLVPGLLATAGRQIRHGQKSVRLFEVGVVIRANDPAGTASEISETETAELDEAPAQPMLAEPDLAETLKNYNAQLPIEARHVAWLIQGERHPGRWYAQNERMAFEDARGVLEALLEAFDPAVAIGITPGEMTGLNPFATAEVTASLDGKKTVLGHVGRLDPETAKRWSLPDDVFVGEINLDGLNALAVRALRARALPRYPSTRRDVAIIAHREVPTESLRQFIAAHAGGALGCEVVERVGLFDRYAGKPIAETHVSLAFAIEYRSPTGTLTDDQVNAAFGALLEALPQNFDVTIRQ